MNTLLHKSVYTPHGKGTIIAEFPDGTVCVRLDATNSGVILHKSEIFPQDRLTRKGPVVSMVA